MVGNIYDSKMENLSVLKFNINYAKTIIIVVLFLQYSAKGGLGIINYEGCSFRFEQIFNVLILK